MNLNFGMNSRFYFRICHAIFMQSLSEKSYKKTNHLILGLKIYVQRVPNLRTFWDLEKTVSHEIHASGNVVGPLLMRKSPTCTHKTKNRGSGNHVGDFCVSGGPPCIMHSDQLYIGNTGVAFL